MTLTSIHESVVGYFRWNLAPEIRSWLNAVLPDVCVRPSGNTTKTLTHVDWRQSFNKEADEGLFIWSTEAGNYGYCPTMVVEVGYSETQNELENDAWKWLWGSEGEVKSVVLIKLIKPSSPSDFGDATKWRGYLEIHIRDENLK
jgi:hypothetical protein